jgi:uncharacterized membrane protein
MQKESRNLLETKLITSVLIFFTILLSYLKFDACRTTFFNGSVSTKSGCYSDIPIFWTQRLLEAHLWPFQAYINNNYQINIPPIEYPVLLGFFIWIVSFLVPVSKHSQFFSGVNYFDVTVIILGICFIIICYYFHKLNPKNFKYLILAPPIALSMFINWDLLAILFLYISLFHFSRKKYNFSAIFLAIGTSVKFFPILLLIPAFVELRKLNKSKANYFAFSFIFTWTVINLPFALINFSGWSYFFRFNFNRNYSYGSIWELINIFGIPIFNINLLNTFSAFLTLFLIYFFIFKINFHHNIFTVAFYPFSLFFIFNKVYSPQYSLWLIVLSSLIVKKRAEIIFYIVWIFFDTIYQFAIWKYIYWQGFGFRTSGISENLYAVVSLCRISSLVIFTLVLIKINLLESKKIKHL